MDIYDYSVDFHNLVKRKGPGSDEYTKKALQVLPKLGKTARILDIGCGSGVQTILLAQNTEAMIISIDIIPSFLDHLRLEVEKLGLQNRVAARLLSMDKLDYTEKNFDVIWSENSICHIGFERGLQYWRKFLKNPGYLVVTDLAWLTEERPAALEEHCQNLHLELDTLANKIATLEKCGYQLLDSFVLPEVCWLDEYYLALKAQSKHFLRKHSGDRVAKMYVDIILTELELYKKFSQYYGLVFYIAQLK